jgi:signal transduction histidine kinase
VFETRHKERLLLWPPILYSKFVIIASTRDHGCFSESEGLRVIAAGRSRHGHSISRRYRDKLFLPKFSTRTRGTGLGLAIVSHIIADHKGRVWVEDYQPCGARFIIELTAGRAEE